jgi:mannitol-1-/sugar-/sorbitol-6-/2-deoxyglucose-6-phosphatase
MNNWQPEAVIFDMDGLLVDSETVWLIAETEMIESRGHSYSDDVRAHIVGTRVDEFIVFLRDHYRLEPSAEALTRELLDHMLRLIPTHVKPQPGANEVIQFVRERGWPLAIASSSPQSVIDAIVEAQGWGDIFRIRCSAEYEAHGKPAPDVYITAAKTLRVNPAQCLALEDSPNGARAAVAAGMVCYAVPDSSHSDHHAFNGITPYVFDSLYDVLDALR